MWSFDLFEGYRYTLTLLVSIYTTAKLVMFIWHWETVAGRGWIGSALVRRYLSVLLLRMRFRQFALELAQLAGLVTILALLIRAHWR